MTASHWARLAAWALAGAAAGCTGMSPEAAPVAATDPPAATSPPGTEPTTTAPPPTTTTTTAAVTTTSSPAPTPPPAAGPLRTGRATHYRLEGSGNCLFPGYPGADRLFVALNATDYGTADLCGAHLSVRGNRGSVTVKVIDQCPECPPGALDLSPEAFARVTGDAGVTTVQWRVVSGPAQPALSFRIKEGSSPWWVGILAIDHRNPVRSLEALAGGRWVALQRQEYNYFVAAQGLGPGPYELRLTDAHGERITVPGITPDAGRVFTTDRQFAGH